VFTRVIRSGAALAGLLLVLILAACGGSPATSTAASEADADQDVESQVASEAAAPSQAAASEGLCALVPIEQVELALGATTDGGVGDESIVFGGETCRFTADDEHVLDVSTSEQTRDEWFEAIETVGMNDEPVDGIGEEAYRAAETALGGPGARLTAWADGREVGITIYSDVDQETTFAAARAIAEAVLAAGE
jgi:hypothetical protein